MTLQDASTTSQGRDRALLRRAFLPAGGAPWVICIGLLAVHAAVRFGGLKDASMIPLSMAIIWPLPWLLSPKDGRVAIGLRRPERLIWFVFGTAAAVVAMAVCALAAWAAASDGPANWFVHHALTLRDILLETPSDLSALSQYLIVTGPALVFSPLAEEFLFRGYVMESISRRWNARTGMLVQATAFSLVHLAHYGLAPFNPMLALVWLPSMFAVAIVLGWIVRRSGSLWPAVVAHAVFNAAMNGVVFWQMPGILGL